MAPMAMNASDEDAQALIAEGKKVREFIASNRSDTLLRIFDYLLQCSIEGQRPRETDIAAEIFPNDLMTTGQQGSRVRVGVYRLRKKLDAFYEGRIGRRLIIPPGEYALQLTTPDGPVEVVDHQKTPSVQPRRAPFLWMAIAALVLINGVVAWLYMDHQWAPERPLVRSPLWGAIAASKHKTYLVIGDHFAFAKVSSGVKDDDIVHDLNINSTDQFYKYTSSSPHLSENLRDQSLYTVSAQILGSVGIIASYLHISTIQPTTSFRLDPTMMQASNIVYVGTLDEMSNLLRTPLMEASGFSCGSHCFDLIDKASSRRFASDSPYVLTDGTVPRRDYGYLASFPGPSGHSVVIVSGTGDAAVRQMAEIVTDVTMIERLRHQLGGNLSAFEALYQVRTMFDQTYGSTLIVARPLNSGHMWDKTKPDE
ncbi:MULTISPECIES: hypothetical protein [unclassified Novosphingobium]|uniref:hypothetical protein n=1 Tax=unclassified Novosphingobium TaxID=2644732 RepID=UPI00086875E2|nr:MULTISPECIES: hypothetical protein [unclassified Novosphingobium]MDR6707610.1 hypothetical protein [Novosphingobium sp. 1748]ODU78049.1 MAG: hypothetical protein ABT10_23525 [Novosphingobium sp. SCN 63-17]OJX96230.1 MAG: hypothetical protein BGP00_16640 [Novosphingobium sp. 63-713]